MRNIFRRQTETAAPTLRERAANLRANLRLSAAAPAALPAPGSAEARAAWETVCREHSKRTQALTRYPELVRPEGGFWTTDTLSEALDFGAIKPAAFARLYPMASEFELGLEQIGHDLNIHALFALAHAKEFPKESEAPVTTYAEDTFAPAPSDRDLCREAFAYARGLDLSAVPLDCLLQLSDVFHREAEVLSDVSQEVRFYADPNIRLQNDGGEIIEAESNRLGCLRDVCVEEVARRTPKTDAERDAILVSRVHHEMLCEMKIRNKTLLAEIREAWGGE